MNYVDKSMAIGASILVFPEGNAVQAGGNCSDAAIPDADDPSWIDMGRIETWEHSRKDAKYEPYKDGSSGVMKLKGEEETDGYNEYKFTSNVTKAITWAMLLRSGVQDNSAGQQNPNAGGSFQAWVIIVLKEKGNIVFAANIWGRLKQDGFKGGGGSLSKPELVFTEYDLAMNTMQIGS